MIFFAFGTILFLACFWLAGKLQETKDQILLRRRFNLVYDEVWYELAEREARFLYLGRLCFIAFLICTCIGVGQLVGVL